jgi:hypothetical protein
LDEQRQVLRAWARSFSSKAEERAPAHSIGAERTRFDVGWLCPICMRNTLRSFDADGLAWREQTAPSLPGAAGANRA